MKNQDQQQNRTNEEQDQQQSKTTTKPRSTTKINKTRSNTAHTCIGSSARCPERVASGRRRCRRHRRERRSGRAAAPRRRASRFTRGREHREWGNRRSDAQTTTLASAQRPRLRGHAAHGQACGQGSGQARVDKPAPCGATPRATLGATAGGSVDHGYSSQEVMNVGHADLGARPSGR